MVEITIFLTYNQTTCLVFYCVVL